MNGRRLKWGLKVFALLLLGFTGLAMGLYYSVIADPPDISDKSAMKEERQEKAPGFYTIKNNWLKKSESGWWEMYLEGSPFERGVYGGKLCKDLLDQQEQAFVTGVTDKIHSRIYLQFLKFFVAIFNRHLPQYIPEEYKEEIYGWSLSASDAYDFIGPKYHRKLNYHAAHDIGHALQNMGLVSGCTALAAWGPQSADSSLILGRNFDFYVGDDFARNKIIAFIKPDKGYPFAMVTWAGMVGAVSGMNIYGLTVTLNAGPSAIPGGAKTPVTILGRRILQYAKTLDEAYQMAAATQVFVSENIMVSSAAEHRAIIIEKAIDTTAMVEATDQHLVCANHFQSTLLKGTEVNLRALKATSTGYRYRRMEQLFERHTPLTPQALADILRDTRGIDGRFIGWGNEMALDQLIAHHSVMFQPGKLRMWVAGSPSQLGPFVAYDLDKVFAENAGMQTPMLVADTAASLPADTLLSSPEYQKYLRFKAMTKTVQQAIDQKQPLTDAQLREFSSLNPEHYYTYLLLGDYYSKLGDCQQALQWYQQGLLKAIPWEKDKVHMQEGMEKCKRK